MKCSRCQTEGGVIIVEKGEVLAFCQHCHYIEPHPSVAVDFSSPRIYLDEAAHIEKVETLGALPNSVSRYCAWVPDDGFQRDLDTLNDLIADFRELRKELEKGHGT